MYQNMLCCTTLSPDFHTVCPAVPTCAVLYHYVPCTILCPAVPPCIPLYHPVSWVMLYHPVSCCSTVYAAVLSTSAVPCTLSGCLSAMMVDTQQPSDEATRMTGPLACCSVPGRSSGHTELSKLINFIKLYHSIIVYLLYSVRRRQRRPTACCTERGGDCQCWRRPAVHCTVRGWHCAVQPCAVRIRFL